LTIMYNILTHYIPSLGSCYSAKEGTKYSFGQLRDKKKVGGSMTIKVLIVDDHSVVRQGLQMFLALDQEIEIIGEATNGLEAIDLAKKLEPDVVLMDLIMPEMDGVAATEAIKKEMPQIEIVAITSVLEDKAIFDAIRVGATGYLLKDTASDKLCEAIKLAAEGQVQLSPKVAIRLAHEISHPDSTENLTDRENEVLCALAHGLSNQEIAEEFNISEKTVKAHVSNILDKLNLPSRTRAALYAIKTGLVSLDEIDIET
jgi:NarL family two-component system response regulator LiaR